MKVDFFTCDVFTSRPFAGNPLLVVPDARGQKEIAIEVGFGPLSLELIREGGSVRRVRMTQGKPAWEPPVRDRVLKTRSAAAIGLPVEAFHPALPVQVVSTGNRTLVLPLRDAASVSAALADVRAMNALEKELDVLIAYLFAFEGERIHARAFCPGAGVPEDPATGSAAGPLGVYLALHGALPGGAPRFFIDQGTEMGRPSEIEVTVELGADGAPSGVRVAGSAVLMMQGHLEA